MTKSTDNITLMRSRLTSVVCMTQIPMYSMLICLIIYFGTLVVIPNAFLRTLWLAYLPYCILDSTPKRGITCISYETVDWLRWWRPFQCVRDHFPVRLHKTTDLSAEEAYIFLYHPHGVIGMGANTALNTNTCGFTKQFPGVRRWGVTLNASFLCPIFREWMLLLGFLSADRSTLHQKLISGDSIVLVPGGAAEALYAHATNFRLYIKNRKGFIRLALDAKVKPIPCLGFGENEAFQTYCAAKDEDSQFYQWQTRLYRVFSFSFPAITNPIPLKRSINVVVGQPVTFSDPTDVDRCHTEYLGAVKELFNEHRGRFGYSKVDVEFL